MSFDLNELRAQREKVREHLNWLDRQIQQLECKAPADQSPPPAAPLHATPEPESQAQPKEPVSETPAPATAEIPMDYKPGGFESSSKLGCILIGILAAGLIIFLLFGLPELLYPDSP